MFDGKNRLAEYQTSLLTTLEKSITIDRKMNHPFQAPLRPLREAV
jgi:hypothetical protein